MRNTVTSLLFATLVGGSSVSGHEVIGGPPPVSAPAFSTRHHGTEPISSGESVLVVFPAARQFGASSPGLYPDARMGPAPHPVAVLRIDRTVPGSRE